MSETITAQEVFTTAVLGVVGQGKRAWSEKDGVCMYRTKDGLKCALGHLIRDDEYVPEMEFKGVAGMRSDRQLPARLHPHQTLIRDLQEAHDDRSGRDEGDANFAATFTERVTDTATRHNLTMPVLP